MEFPLQDKGKYFRGLLILIGRDNVIHSKEKNRILKIGENLGFESRFCFEAVESFLSNTYIDQTPPVFSSSSIAHSFLKDAIKLSMIDDEVHINELEWLKKVAFENNISNKWLDKEIQTHANSINEKTILS